MSDRLLQFTHVDPRPPTKRPPGERRRDFKEIHRAFSPEDASTQAGRCSQCGVPFCQSGCPLQNNIPDWLQLEADGRLREAYLASAATNPMPEICGRICPQDRLCEGVCVIEQSGHGAVTIGAVEKHITETAWAEGWVEPVKVGEDRGSKVAIVGAGPAGLAAAERLRERGYGAAIFDRHDRAGGLLTYGIPDFKLEKHVVDRRVDRLKDAGVEVHLGVDVGGSGAPFSEIRNTHAATLIATGVYEPRNLMAPGVGATGVVPALDYLFTANRICAGRSDERFESGELNTKNKRVIVIGGGDTAMDCVRTAVRQGATSVTCLYRRDRANMPGSAREVKSAEEEGVVFEWLAQPKSVLDRDGVVTGVRSIRMRLGPPDASGRQAPEETPGSEFDLPADMVVLALGFDPEDSPKLFEAPELAVTRRGALKVEPFGRGFTLDEGAGMTSLAGVFAAGDIVRGASLVVRAVKDGLDAADQIHAWLEAEALRAERTAAQ